MLLLSKTTGSPVELATVIVMAFPSSSSTVCGHSPRIAPGYDLQAFETCFC